MMNLSSNQRFSITRFTAIRKIALSALVALMLGQPAYAATDKAWTGWLNNQIDQHPDVIAARAKMNAVYAFSDAKKRALYNPELSSEFEREGGDSNFSVELTQTLDWSGKRELGQQQAKFDNAAALAQFELVRQQKTAQALRAIVNWQGSNEQATLALAQETQLNALLKLIKQRNTQGDISQIDSELAYLSLSQTLNSTADALAGSKKAKVMLRAILPGWSARYSEVPPAIYALPQNSDSSDRTNSETSTGTRLNNMLDQLPVVIAAKASWQASRVLARLAKTMTKADPTVGIKAGKNADDNVIGVSFSIPLNIRNNYNDQARAATEQSLSAEANYLSTRRRQQAAIAASTDVYLTYRQRYQRWTMIMEGRGKRSAELLQTQWQSGDISTTEYLLALQQRNDALSAGIELTTKYKLASIERLLQTGTITNILMSATAN